MAGGIGSRFWPISTPEYPKQFIDILGVGKTLIQLTVERFQTICPVENMWVVTNESYAEIVKQQIPNIPDENILKEPEARNTAPCIAYACWKIKKKDADANIVVTPSDAIVMNVAEYQRMPYTQSKLVRCVKGAVLDVAVDIRKGSPTFGQHVAVELTEDNHRQFFIPRGFAHGFAVLSETAVFQYKCDEFYHPEADGGINIKDESLGIDWRIPMEKAILSEKDLKHACLKDAVLDFDINDKLY